MAICTNVDAATMEAHGYLAALMNWYDMMKTHYIYIRIWIRMCSGYAVGLDIAVLGTCEGSHPKIKSYTSSICMHVNDIC